MTPSMRRIVAAAAASRRNRGTLRFWAHAAGLPEPTARSALAGLILEGKAAKDDDAVYDVHVDDK